MNDKPRQQLGEIITKHGQDAYNPQRCEGLLRDYCGQYKKEIFLLVNALKKGVVGELIKSKKDGISSTIVLARLTKKLQDELGITAESALWAVDSWGLALGIISQPRSIEPPDRTQKLELPELPQSIPRKMYIWAGLSTLAAVCLGIAYYLNARNLDDTKIANDRIINGLSMNVTRLDRENQNHQNTLEDLENNLANNSASTLFLAQSTYINFCNKSSTNTISAAIMYRDGLQSRSIGWWSIAKGECKKALVGAKYQGSIYIHGETPIIHDIKWESKDFSFCATKTSEFNFLKADEKTLCIGENRFVNASKFIVFPGVNNYTFKDYKK
jgi:uncharacterized membrane protein